MTVSVSACGVKLRGREDPVAFESVFHFVRNAFFSGMRMGLEIGFILFYFLLFQFKPRQEVLSAPVCVILGRDYLVFILEGLL